MMPFPLMRLCFVFSVSVVLSVGSWFRVGPSAQVCQAGVAVPSFELYGQHRGTPGLLAFRFRVGQGLRRDSTTLFAPQCGGFTLL